MINCKSDLFGFLPFPWFIRSFIQIQCPCVYASFGFIKGPQERRKPRTPRPSLHTHPNTPNTPSSSTHYALRPRTTLHTRLGCAGRCKPSKDFNCLCRIVRPSHFTHRYPNKMLNGKKQSRAGFIGNVGCQHSLCFSVGTQN